MLSLSPLKIVIVLVVALVLVGPDKLPGLARQIGGAWRAFRSFSNKVETEVRSTMPDLPSTGDIARLARSPVAFLDSLAKLDIEPLVPDPAADPAPQTDGLAPDPGAPSVASPSSPLAAIEEQGFGDPTVTDETGSAAPEIESTNEEHEWDDGLIPSEPVIDRPAPVRRSAATVVPGAIDPNLN